MARWHMQAQWKSVNVICVSDERKSTENKQVN